MLYLILLLPFLLGIGCAFCKEENARRLTPVLAAAQTVLTALVIYAAVSGKDWATNVVYLSESLTFSLKMDGVAAVFAVVTAVCWLLTIPYAAVYMPHSGGEPRFYVFLFTTEAVLLGTALAADMVTLYLFYELTTLCSAPLVLHELKKKAIIGAYKYLFYSVGGAFVALFGVVALYFHCDSLSFAAGGTMTEATPLTLAAVFCMILGFGAKAGLFPLHNWLPSAHPAAPAPASALLSGLIAKAGVIAPLEHTAITNMMGLENHLVPSAMTARDSIIYFSLDESDESIREKISLTPHNKFLVVDGDIDHVLGVVDGKQLLKLYADGESLSIRKPGIVQPIITIPDSLTLTETLDLFKKESSDFAVVINEYGLTVGIITLKDILWPVMGNYDVWADDQLLVERADGTWLVDGSTPVDDIEREFGIESMPEEETYETVSGFIMYMLRRVPKRGDFVEYAGYRFEVTNMDGFHIDQVLMRRADHHVKHADKAEKVEKAPEGGADASAADQINPGGTK